MTIPVSPSTGQVKKQPLTTRLSTSGILPPDLGYVTPPGPVDFLGAENSCAVVEDASGVKAMIFAATGGHASSSNNGVYVFSFMDWTWGTRNFTAWTWDMVLASSNNYGNPITVSTTDQVSVVDAVLCPNSRRITISGVNGTFPPSTSQNDPNDHIGPVGTCLSAATNAAQPNILSYPHLGGAAYPEPNPDTTWKAPVSRHTYGGIVWFAPLQRVYIYGGSAWVGGGTGPEHFWELKSPANRLAGRAWKLRANPNAGIVTDSIGRWPCRVGIAPSHSEVWNGKLLVKTSSRLVEITIPDTGDVTFHCKSTNDTEEGEGGNCGLIEPDRRWWCVMGFYGRRTGNNQNNPTPPPGSGPTAYPGMSAYNLDADPATRQPLGLDTSTDNWKIFNVRSNWSVFVSGEHGPGVTWDSERHKFVMWGSDLPTGSSWNSLYTLHLNGTGLGASTVVKVERHDLVGDVVPVPRYSGTYRKFLYLPQDDAFALWNGYTEPFYVFRLSAVGATKQIAVPSSLAITVGTPA